MPKETIIWEYKGQIEKWINVNSKTRKLTTIWVNGYSFQNEVPWLTKRQAQQYSNKLGKKAVFVYPENNI
jgi:hypothetical protein